MEDFDQYMITIKWCPSVAELAKIAKWNDWVRIHYFTNTDIRSKRELIKYKNSSISTKIKSYLMKLLIH